MSRRRPLALPALPSFSAWPVARWLVPAAMVCCVAFLGKEPAIDEESYLWIGAHLNVLHPYDWQRIWQPYGTSDSFVYAHPPLFLWFLAAVHASSSTVWVQRVLCGLPFVALYAWGTARWATRVARHPHLVGGLWLASTTVQLGLQDSLMIDLPAVALVTAGLALYRDGLDEGEGLGRAGVLLGLALATKYSMAMVAVPVLVHLAVAVAGRRLPLPYAMLVVGPMLGIPLVGEALMLISYGRLHFWEVWVHRHDILSGPLDARFLGVLARMAFLPLPAVLAMVRPGIAAAGALLGLAALAWSHPEGAATEQLAGLLLCTCTGAVGLVRAFSAMVADPVKRRKGDRDDGLLLGGVVVGVVAGVALGHNYASARYLLPAATPLAILMTRSAEEVSGGKTLLRVTMIFSAVLAMSVSVADYRFASAGVEVANAAARRAPTPSGAGLRLFAGEWGFRYALEGLGWTRYEPGQDVPAGSVVIVATQESPGEIPRGQWDPIDRVESDDRFPLRVNLIGHGVSLYAETLGAMPLGMSGDALEAATIYRVGPDLTPTP